MVRFPLSQFLVDVDLWTDLQRAGHSDRLEDTIDYVQVRISRSSGNISLSHTPPLSSPPLLDSPRRYGKQIFNLTKESVESKNFDMIEALGADIFSSILGMDSRIGSVRVSVKKPQVCSLCVFLLIYNEFDLLLRCCKPGLSW